MLTTSFLTFRAMEKKSQKSNLTLELSMVLSFFMLINFTCISSCKHQQVRNKFVSCRHEVEVVSNTSFSFKSVVSKHLKTQALQAFAGFCVFTNLVSLLITSKNHKLLITS